MKSMPRPKLQTQRSSIVLDTTGLLSPATAAPFLTFIFRSTVVVVAVALSVSPGAGSGNSVCVQKPEGEDGLYEATK